MICRLGEAAQFRLTLYRQVQVQVHRIAHFLREGFSAQLRAASEALLLCWIHMNKRCGHVGSYITPISYHGNSSVESSSKRLEQQRLLFGKNGAQVENQAIVFDARDDGDAGGSTPQTLLPLRRGGAAAGDSNDFSRKRLRGRGAPARPGSTISPFDFALVQRQFRTPLADES